MTSRTKRRVRAAVVASALSSGFMLMAMFGFTTAMSGCNEAGMANTQHTKHSEQTQPATEQPVEDDQTAGEAAEIVPSAVFAVSEMSVSGEISKIKKSSFNYKDDDAKEHTVMVDDSTTYTLDGQETTFSGLKVGHTINATLKTDGDSVVTKAVVATSRVD